MIFVFNLIVGTGALTLPSVFSRAGWLLGSLIIILLAFISYVTLTFIIETCSCANAIANQRKLRSLREHGLLSPDSDDAASTAVPGGASSGTDDLSVFNAEGATTTDNEEVAFLREPHIETTPLFVDQRKQAGYYVLDDKYELGELATLFFNRAGIVSFYICICVYLYGDLSIYNAAVAKSVTDVVCGSANSTNYSATAVTYFDYEQDEECWPGMLRFTFYKINLICFVCLLGPFAFFNVTKTKYIQVLTAVFRWVAFAIMILIACLRFFNGKADGHPPVADFSQVANLFGACIYSFMCHHSLPSLISPIRQKEKLKFAISLDYVGIALFYLLLAITGAFAFSHLNDLYTLNFIPNDTDDSSGFNVLKLVEYFLALFPVFTLSASYPIIAITLRNNLQILFRDISNVLDSRGLRIVSRLLFPLMAIVPPLVITFNTENINSLVRFTGSYAGAGIQYIIPVALVFSARKKTRAILGSHLANRFESPFRHGAWLACVLIWTVVCVCLVSMTFIWSK